SVVLNTNGIPVTQVRKVHEGHPHIVDTMKNAEVALVFNTTEGAQSLKDSFDIRATALLNKIPYYTTAAGAAAATRAIENLRAGDLEVAPLQSYFQRA
ncbi:MAG: hypothetical protein AAFV62_10705, partial [Pseudomonadota bacterium]